ncbi:hypothetical protein KAT92_04145 [Candidatus Babeliales bacterium]|nr:hypothetical protein [Candidatus Babeliales bacterium]
MKKERYSFFLLPTLIFSLALFASLDAGRLVKRSPSHEVPIQKRASFSSQTTPFSIENNTIANKDKIISDYELALTSTNPVSFERTKITIKTDKGLVRHGTLTTRPNARGNVVLCHPAAYDQHFMTPYEENVFSYYNCIRFDFRRHGENNKGQSTTIGKREAAEIKAAAEFLKKHPKTKHLPIYGFGVSMGASALIGAECKYHQFDALILQSPFESLKEQIKREFPVFRRSFFHNFIFGEPVRIYAKLRYRIRLEKFHPEQKIKKIRTPIFLMHARNDRVIKFIAFKKLKTAGRHCIIKTWTPKNGGHTEFFKTFPDLYTKKCNEFLDKVAKSYKYLNYKIAHAKNMFQGSKLRGSKLQRNLLTKRRNRRVIQKDRQKYLLTTMLHRKETRS